MITDERACDLIKIYNSGMKVYLSPREQKMFEMRFGLAGGINNALGQIRTHTFEEIGREFGITKGRAGQIVKECVGKLLDDDLYWKLKQN